MILFWTAVYAAFMFALPWAVEREWLGQVVFALRDTFDF